MLLDIILCLWLGHMTFIEGVKISRAISEMYRGAARLASVYREQHWQCS